MINLIVFLLGISLVIGTIIDILWTTLWIGGGAGPITNMLSNKLWALFSSLIKVNKNSLKLAGPIILAATLFEWVLLLWAGWAIAFSSDIMTESIINTVNKAPIVWQNYIYYSGYTLFTLGSGDYAPATPFWQLLTAAASGTGMLFFTFGASYIISIVGAVIDKRSFASSIMNMGSSAEEIVKTSWNGRDFKNLDLLLMNLSDNLGSLSIKHKAYPLLHYYHTANKTEATEVAIPVIDNALSIIEFGIEPQAKPNPILLKKCRNCIDSYLDTLERTHIKAAKEPLRLPNISDLEKLNLPMVKKEQFKKEMENIANRRKKLLGLLTEDNWQEDVLFGNEESDD